MTSRRAQRGQVLVLGLLLAVVLGAAAWRQFALGQLIGAKARLVQGLDAAAYSGALVQARTLNFLSYVNRARLADQLAMAHLITLGSWAHYGGTQAKRLAQGNPPAYLIGMLFGADHGRAYLSAGAALGLDMQALPGHSLAQAFAAHEAFVHDHAVALSDALVRGLPAARLSTMRQVLAAHYPERTAQDFPLRIHTDTWPTLLESRTADASLRPLVKSLAGLYGFLAAREQTARNAWSVDARCPAMRHELRRRGATTLDEQGRWQASDTQSFHAVRSNRWIGCYYREYAMGWAWMPGSAGQAIGQEPVTDAPGNFAAQDFWRWVQEATQWDIVGGQSNPLADAYATQSAIRWPSRGLGTYVDVNPRQQIPGTAGFVVTLTLPGPDGQTLQARSAAETVFSRPQARRDGQHETPNLFRPYWQAHLSKPLLLFAGGTP